MMFGNFARKLAGMFKSKSKPTPQKAQASSGVAPISIGQLATEARAAGSGRSWAPNPASISSGSKPSPCRPANARHRNPPRPNKRNPRGRAARQRARHVR